jgi:hypothetical protein
MTNKGDVLFFIFFLKKKCWYLFFPLPWTVWKCGCDYFSCWNVSKWFFLFFSKLFLRSALQNDPKHIKKLIFKKRGLHRIPKQNRSLSLKSVINICKSMVTNPPSCMLIFIIPNHFSYYSIDNKSIIDIIY